MFLATKHLKYLPVQKRHMFSSCFPDDHSVRADVSFFRRVIPKSWNQPPLRRFLPSVCLMWFLPILITRPLDFPEGCVLPGFIGSNSSYQRTEPHLHWWLMAADTPQGSFCPRFFSFPGKKEETKSHEHTNHNTSLFEEVSLIPGIAFLLSPPNTR